MTRRLALLALLPLALASCTTSGGNDLLSQRWNGVEAGKFFAAYGPPQQDASAGSGSTYSWRGGYARRTIPAAYEKDADGKKGKMISKARTMSLSCGVEIKVDSNYKISSIRATIDRELNPNSASYCEEFLDAAKK